MSSIQDYIGDIVCKECAAQRECAGARCWAEKSAACLLLLREVERLLRRVYRALLPRCGATAGSGERQMYHALLPRCGDASGNGERRVNRAVPPRCGDASGSGERRVYRALLPDAAAGSGERRMYRALLLPRCGEAAGYR